MKIISFLGTLTVFAGLPALASLNITTTYSAAGSQSADTAALCNSAITCAIGVEDFSNFTGGTYATTFNSNGSQSLKGSITGTITGTLTGGSQAASADQYGGAGGSGKYSEVFSGGTETLTLSTSGNLGGVNYLGLWFSALDAGNLLSFYQGSSLVYAFTPADFRALVGNCNGSNSFCGNPTGAFLGTDSHEQFAFLNFFAPQGQYFNKVVFSQNGGGGFESDNYTVGFINPIHPVGTVVPGAVTPEPSGVGMALIGGALLLGCVQLRKRLA